MTIAHPIARAWLSTGGDPGRGTGAQNYDEFADDAEITAIITANPATALAVEMPHLAPASLGRPFRECLPDAVARLAADKTAGRYAPAENVTVLYRISGPSGPPGYGLWCMVDTAEISTNPDEPGSVIRNEDVFIEKVRERVALAEATRHLLSPVLLLQTAHGDELRHALAEAAAAAGAPRVADVDAAGRTHEIWPIDGVAGERLLALAGGGELVVADGNHRSLAAQLAGLHRFLAVVTTAGSVRIDPYNRLVTESPVPPAEAVERLVALGATVEPLSARPAGSPPAGTLYLYAPGGAWAVGLPKDQGMNVAERIDHAVCERLLFVDVLGLDPGDKRVTYVGGDYPAEWVCGEVDAERAELAVLIAPVTVEDFLAVNLARRKMPRKSTWFSPKARAGLVVADLAAES